MVSCFYKGRPLLLPKFHPFIMKSLNAIIFGFCFLFASMVVQVAAPTSGECYNCGKNFPDLINHWESPSKTPYYPIDLYVCWWSQLGRMPMGSTRFEFEGYPVPQGLTHVRVYMLSSIPYVKHWDMRHLITQSIYVCWWTRIAGHASGSAGRRVSSPPRSGSRRNLYALMTQSIYADGPG